MIIRSLLVASALTMLATAGLAADGQTSAAKKSGRIVTDCGKLTKTKVVQSSASQSTTSSAFVDVVGSTLNFTIPGTSPTCVTVDFSAQAFAPGSGKVLHVRAVRDGSIISIDDQIQLVDSSTAFSDAHAYNFVFTNVPPGAHTVKMQYNSFPGGSNTTTINDFNMVVRHK